MKKGFTLPELVIIIGIIGILTAIVLIAVNPGKQFAQVRDAQRKADLSAITNAIYQFASENNGNLPDTDPDPKVNNFPSTATCIGTSSDCFNLAGTPIVPTYIAAIPKDPATGSDRDTMYTIYRDANGKLLASASGELTDNITEERKLPY